MSAATSALLTEEPPPAPVPAPAPAPAELAPALDGPDADDAPGEATTTREASAARTAGAAGTEATGTVHRWTGRRHRPAVRGRDRLEAVGQWRRQAGGEGGHGGRGGEPAAQQRRRYGQSADRDQRGDDHQRRQPRLPRRRALQQHDGPDRAYADHQRHAGPRRRACSTPPPQDSRHRSRRRARQSRAPARPCSRCGSRRSRS